MKNKNYRGAAIHNTELEHISSIENPSTKKDFNLSPNYEIRNFEVCKNLGYGKYLCQYINIFSGLAVPIDGNPLSKSNLEMAHYLYDLEHGKGNVTIISTEDCNDKPPKENR